MKNIFKIFSFFLLLLIITGCNNIVSKEEATANSENLNINSFKKDIESNKISDYKGNFYKITAKVKSIDENNMSVSMLDEQLSDININVIFSDELDELKYIDKDDTIVFVGKIADINSKDNEIQINNAYYIDSIRTFELSNEKIGNVVFTYYSNDHFVPVYNTKNKNIYYINNTMYNFQMTISFAKASLSNNYKDRKIFQELNYGGYESFVWSNNNDSLNVLINLDSENAISFNIERLDSKSQGNVMIDSFNDKVMQDFLNSIVFISK